MHLCMLLWTSKAVVTAAFDVRPAILLRQYVILGHSENGPACNLRIAAR